MIKDVWTLWAIILFIASLSLYLEGKYKFAAKISGAILALIIAMIFSNLKIIPFESPVYDTVFTYVIPLSIPMLLFNCNLIEIYKNSGRLLLIFLLSSMGTIIGTVLAFFLLKNYIPHLNKIAGTMAATYIGGGVNFIAVSSGLNIEPKLVSAAIVSDNLIGVLFFLSLIIIPSISFFNKHFIREYAQNIEENIENKKVIKEFSVKDIAFSFAISTTIVAISSYISKISALNFYLILTTITIIAATVFSKYLVKIEVAQELGTFLIYIFFVVIGIPASLEAIIKNSPLLLVFCLIIVTINLIVTLLFAKILNYSLEEALLVSNANIGGPTTAAAMAISKSWNKHVAPIILVGILGYSIGTYIGIFMSNILI